MKVLLINPPAQPYLPPLVVPFGIAYIALELERNGYKAELLDIDTHRLSKSQVSEFIEISKPDIIGIGGLVTVYPYLDWLIPEIRRLKDKIEIILGGGVASALRERCFKRFDIDYEVIGEGEVTIVELLREIQGGRKFSSVKGIGFRDNGNAVFTENRPLMTSLDNVPIIDDTLFPIEKLLKNSGGALQIHTQRGCPANCTFCFNCFRVVSSKVRYRPVANVLNEIESLKGKYKNKIKLFVLSGECLTMNKEWIINFCKEILKRNLKIQYRVTSRVDTIDEEGLEWLRRSGCVRMSLGLETGSAKILKIINKGSTIEQGKRAVVISKKYIETIEASIMLGYAGENKETLRETVNFCKEIGVKPLLFYPVAFPGTELYKMAIAKGCIKNEEEYMMGLDKSSIFDKSLNLTDMPDDVAEREIEAAKNEIERYYFYRDFSFRLIKDIFMRTYLNLKNKGLKVTLIKIFKNMKKYLRQ